MVVLSSLAEHPVRTPCDWEIDNLGLSLSTLGYFSVNRLGVDVLGIQELGVMKRPADVFRPSQIRETLTDEGRCSTRIAEPIHARLACNSQHSVVWPWVQVLVDAREHARMSVEEDLSCRERCGFVSVELQ